MTVDKTEEMQVSGDSEDVELKGVAAEKDASVEGVKFDKELEQETDVSEATIPADVTKKEEEKDTFIFQVCHWQSTKEWHGNIRWYRRGFLQI